MLPAVTPSADSAPRPASRAAYAGAFVLRGLAFAVVWWAMTEGAQGPLVFGVIASVAAAGASVALLPPPWPRLQMVPLLRFVPYFLRQSVAGGIDVVRRAASPQVPVDPALVDYDVAHMGKAERIAFTLIVNLIPGTLSTRLHQDCLTLHAIDQTQPVQVALEQLDARLGAIVGRVARGVS